MAEWMKKEGVRQQKVKTDRQAAKTCIMCGKPLRRIQRIFGVKHKECEEFSD
jgi:hypothetical protein